MQTQSGIMEVKDAAAELHVTELAILRVIARGRLKATRITPQNVPLIERQKAVGHWRILAAELAAYVQRGAPDLTLPALEQNGELAGWFDDRETNKATQVGRKITAALEGSLPDVSDEMRRLQDAGQPLERILGLTPAILVVIDGPVQPTVFDPPHMRGVSRYANQGQLFMMSELRKVMRHSADSAVGQVSLAELYAGPEEYTTLVGKATARLKAMRLTNRVPLQLTWPPEKTARGDMSAPRTISTSALFLLPYTALMSSAEIDKLHEVAF